MRRTMLGWIAFAAIVSRCVSVFGQADPPPATGLDLVLLVDVSGSMSNPPEQSDKDLKRWTAAQLVLNMLTFDDRVVVIPFNHVAPATNRIEPDPNADLVPLPLDERLELSGVARPSLLPRINEILLRRAHPDQGDTAIFDSLRFAATKFGSVSTAGLRNRVVVLLTDGDEKVRPAKDPAAFKLLLDPEGDSRRLREELSPWIGSDGRTTPIHTIALGRGANAELLARIAGLTKGSGYQIDDNRTLVETFRDLIWTLKGAWVRRVDLTGPGPKLQPLGGLVDVGYLAYRVDGNVARPLPGIGVESFSFAPAGEVPPQVELRPGSSYAYFFSGRVSSDEPRPFGLRDAAPHSLSLAWPGGGDEARDFLWVAVRTPNPLFSLLAPVDYGRYSRMERVPARVRFAGGNTFFKDDDFDVSLRMEPIGAPTGAPAERIPLRWVPGFGEFQADLPLRRLPRGANAEVDAFNLIIEAKGKSKAGRTTALSGAEHTVGRRTVFVENAFALDDVEPVRLGRSRRSRAITIRTINREIKDPFEVVLALKSPVASPTRALDARSVLVVASDAVPRPLTVGGVRVKVENGEAKVDLRLDDANFPAPGNYENGELTISAPELGLIQKNVAFDVDIDVVTLSTTPRSLELIAGRKTESEPIVVAESIDGKPAPAGAGVKEAVVELVPQPGSERFTTSELRIEPVDGPAPETPSARITIAPGRAFRIRFQPEIRADRVGRHAYVWEVSAGKDVVKARGNLTLAIDPPKLVVGAAATVPSVSPGGRARIAVPIRFEHPAKGEWSLHFRPAETDRTRTVFGKRGGNETDKSSRPDLIHPSPKSPQVYAGTAPGTMEFEVVLPENHPYGVYEAKGFIEGPKIAPVEVAVAVAVDDLTLEWWDRRERTWKPVDGTSGGAIRLRRTLERDMAIEARVGTRLGSRLDPAALAAEIPGPYQSDAGEQLGPKRLPRHRPDAPRADEPNWIRLLLALPEVASADKDTFFRCPGEIRFNGLPLKPIRFEFVTSFNP